MSARLNFHGWRLAVTLCFVLAIPALAAAQTTFSVGDQTALSDALTAARSGDTILFSHSITLSGNLAGVSTDGLTIDGGGFTLSGANQYRGLAIGSFDGMGNPVNLTLQNITIANTLAAGGAGGSGAAGGG